ncbi:hypothetical protein DFA_03396 [Cavenderia fasciculata]|uniref:Uncharacterized protein n=1 Tax=Cavenderia fasciculata TaxID=261658 RepID=F4PHG5_CACFS|nr:uncharacterized protein DFA_03396 [Cavenderia fasciculata]EGG25149.1 hypothetical protein DFA_03396 [Cavenderia fasciculata]|eukprot:XP_004363000.1 hypothetical protein DFA_03396 [Cavenderia fasciculata]
MDYLKNPNNNNNNNNYSNNNNINLFGSFGFKSSPIQNIENVGNITQYIKVGKDGSTLISNPKDIGKSESAIGLMGPPGSGKSSICNTLCFILYKIMEPYFVALRSHETVTLGVYTLSQVARLKSPVTVNKDVLDMEGHDNSLERSWKMAMLLSVICEEIVLCNRDARATALIQAVSVFKKGMDQSSALGMRPITKQMFFMVKSMRDAPSLLHMLAQILPSMEFIPFTVPEFTDDEVDQMTTPLEFHPAMVKAIKEGVVDKIKPRLDKQSLSSKADSIQQLLHAFNIGDYSQLDAINKKLFLADCNRILDEAIANGHIDHMDRAKKITVSEGMTLAQFLKGVNGALSVDFNKSTFYVKGKSEGYIKQHFPSPSIPTKMIESIYTAQYNLKMAKLAEAKAIAEQADRNKKMFLEGVQIINKAAELKLSLYIDQLKFGQSFVPSKETFIDRSPIAHLKTWGLHYDFGPFHRYYDSVVPGIAQKWIDQTSRAKWKAPVHAHGDMTCQGGCKMNDSVFCYKSTCRGRLYWVDGPSSTAICQTCETKASFVDTTLYCIACGNRCNCTTRPNGSYIP